MCVFWRVGLDLVPLVGRATFVAVFWGVCEISMSLGILSANAWGCVLVLVVVGMGRPALEVAVLWVELGLSVETEISGRALAD